ncbi:helix-turn-helix domain-containing protein [Streptomyces sp. NPDC058420]|uniref:helix-turn-helix domain-containing protein n=1 Tax=Streptomyces sp. NPDC058420 TaxID=3346489 RepID=UPI003652110E
MSLSQAQLGTLVFVSGTYISQFEQAIRKPQMELAVRFDEILRTVFSSACAWA